MAAPTRSSRTAVTWAAAPGAPSGGPRPGEAATETQPQGPLAPRGLSRLWAPAGLAPTPLSRPRAPAARASFLRSLAPARGTHRRPRSSGDRPAPSRPGPGVSLALTLPSPPLPPGSPARRAPGPPDLFSPLRSGSSPHAWAGRSAWWAGRPPPPPPLWPTGPGRGRRAQLRPSGVRTRVPAAGLVRLAAVRRARATARGHHHAPPPRPHTAEFSAVPRLRR